MARLNAGMMCIKYILFISNFIFVLLGILVISMGSALLTIYKDFETFLESHHFHPAEIFIAVGVIIFLVSLVGSIGAIKKSTMLVNLYAFLLFLLLVVEISAAIAAFVLRWTIFDDIKDNMMDSLKDYTRSDDAKQVWDFTQENMHCCGVEYPHDWKSHHVNEHPVVIAGDSFTVPYSCCNNFPSFCDSIYRDGCLKSLEKYVSDASLAIGYVAIGVVLIQLSGVIIACLLAKAIRRVKTEQEMERQQNLGRFSDVRPAGQEPSVGGRPALYIPNSSSTDA